MTVHAYPRQYRPRGPKKFAEFFDTQADMVLIAIDHDYRSGRATIFCPWCRDRHVFRGMTGQTMPCPSGPFRNKTVNIVTNLGDLNDVPSRRHNAAAADAPRAT